MTMTGSVETTNEHSRPFAYGINMATAFFHAGVAVMVAKQ
jgi:hypothetical protein